MSIFGDDLLDGKLPPTFGVLPKPNQAKASSAEKFDLFEAVREPISEDFFLFFG